MVKPLGTRGLIKPSKPSKQIGGGLILPGSVLLGGEVQDGIVVSIADVIDKNGSSVDLGVTAGDKVIYGKSVGTKYMSGEVEHIICDINDIWSVSIDRVPVEGQGRCICGAQVEVQGDTTLSYKLVNSKQYFQKSNPDIEVPFRCKVCGAIDIPFRALRDVVMMYVMPEPEKIGSIYLPEEDNYVGGNMRSREKKPYAVILKVGQGYYDKKKRLWKKNQPYIECGDVVYYEKRIPKGWSFEVEGVDAKMHKVSVCGIEDVYGLIDN